MSSKASYQFLKNQEEEHDPQVQITQSKPKMTKLRRYIRHNDSKQALKKKFKTIHEISFQYQKFVQPLSVSDIRRLTTLLKRLKHVSKLGLDMNSLPCNHKVLLRFFQSLKHSKYFSEIHIYFIHNTVPLYTKELVHVSCQTLRYIRALPQRKIKLTLPFSLHSLAKNENKFLKSLAKHKCFTSAHFTFEYNYQISHLQEMMTILSNSKSLSQLSLTFKLIDFKHAEAARRSHDTFYTLKRMKTVKNCRVCLQTCAITNPKLKALVPILKEAVESFNLEFIIEDSHTEITRYGWWLFRRSIQNLCSPHIVSVKHIGKLELISRGRAFLFTLIAVIISLIYIMRFLWNNLSPLFL